MRPFAARRALVGLDDVSDHDVDRHAVAPGIVERHRGVLQADHAVAHHGHRLAFHLGIALRDVDRDLLVRAGEDFGLGVLSVVDQRFVDAAEARSAGHRQIIEIERLEHIHHEVPAGRCLRHWISYGRQRVGRDLLGSRHGRLEVGPRRGDLRLGGARRQRGGADQARTLEKIATRNIRRILAFRHGRTPSGYVRFPDDIGASRVVHQAEPR
jgi:hypothetical protein